MSKVHYIDPSINLLDSLDSRLDSWRISRPHLEPGDVETDYSRVAKLDLPVAGFRHFTFEIHGSIFFRDLLFSLRPITPWAFSTRTTKFTRENLKISSEYSDQNDFNVECIDRVLNMMAEGQTQDAAKLYLPQSVSTPFSVSLDERTLANFLSSLRAHNTRLYGVYGTLFLKAIGETEEEFLDKKMIDIWGSYALTDEEYKAAKDGYYSEQLKQICVGQTIQSGLFSQVLRQHYAKISSSIFNTIDNNGTGDTRIDCTHPVSMITYTLKPAFDKVKSVRTCWFAMFDKSDDGSWSHILEPVVKDMSSQEFLNTLPCKGKCSDCTIRGEIYSRVRLDEVNLPCPVLIEMPSLVDTRKEKYGADSIIYQKWKDSQDLIVDNPENDSRKEYLENLRKNGGKDGEGYQVLKDPV